MDNPKYIKATREIFYDVPAIVKGIQEVSEEGHVVTYDEIMDKIRDWAEADLGCEWGHTLSDVPIQYTEEY